MKEVLTYIAGVVACSGLFVLFYRLVLHRHGGEGSFRTARIFLPASLVASVVIPALKIPVWPSAPVEIPYIMQALPMAETPLPAAAPTVDVLQVVLWVLYGIGIAVLAGVMVWQAAKIARIRRRAEIHNMERCTVAVSEEVSAPFSFLATVYVGRETSPDEMRQIVLHEGSHIRHRHSVEKIIMETLKALLWFNPFAWWASRLLVEVHEFEADRDVLRGGYTVEEYLPVIFRQIFGYVPEISTGLGNSLTKKRLLMMRKTMKQSRFGWLRAAGVLPLAAGMLALFSFTSRTPEIVMTGAPEVVEQAPEPAAQKPEPDVKVYEATVEKKSATAAKSPDEPVYVAEVMPVFQNGDLNTFRRWVMERIIYPKEAMENNITGKVVAKFIVEKDGSVSNIEVVSSPDKVLSDEVVRVIGLSPAWTPGAQKGKPVRVYYIIPVDFLLQGNDDKPAKPAADAEPAEQPAMKEVMVVGYGTQRKENGGELSGTVTVGYGTQKKTSTTIINIDGKDGKPHGITVMGDPNIHHPLILLDGKEITKEQMQEIDPATIESISVLKDESATKVYGEKGKNGVIIITLKGEGEESNSAKKARIVGVVREDGTIERIDGKLLGNGIGIGASDMRISDKLENEIKMFTWLESEKRAMNDSDYQINGEHKFMHAEKLNVIRKENFDKLPDEIKAAMGDGDYDAVAIVTTKK